MRKFINVFILVLLGSYNFDIYDLIYKLIRSFLLNIIYIFICTVKL